MPIKALILSIVVGYGFSYATFYLSPLGKLKWKPFSCPDCLAFWGGGTAYYFLSNMSVDAIIYSIVAGFITLTSARWFRLIEGLVVRLGKSPSVPQGLTQMFPGPCSPCGDNKGGEENGKRI